ncbi:MAG: hypothetical protein A2X46_17890 [Lentisphaerae bacterium GWF2_57_35]|nr:MAG: hypothetical protein A2X46_17890 [Lentisphaerae bacterium GWF2_57_35]
MIALLGVLLLAAGWTVSRVAFDDSLESMIPEGGALRSSLRLLNAAQISGKVIVWVQRDPRQTPDDVFFQSLDNFAQSLSSPLISRVITAQNMFPSKEDLGFFMTSAPQLLRPADYEIVERKLTDESISNALKNIRREMLSPQSLVSAEIFRRDPLGVRAMALKPLERLGEALGYQIAIQGGHFTSEDGSSAMIVLETPAAIMDHARSQALLDFLNERMRALPSGMKAGVICGHLHTLSNQAVIKRDIGVAGFMSAGALLVLFFLLFRDLRAALIFAIPPACILPALAFVTLLGFTPALIVIGLTGLIAGIAVDYGIHAFLAVAHRLEREAPMAAIRRIRAPLLTSAATTIAAFLAFMFSSAPGYRQLGLLAAATLILALALSLWLLPLLLGERRIKTAALAPNVFGWTAKKGPLVLVIFTVFFLAALLLASRVTVESDFSRLDGTAPAIKQYEDDFFRQWGAGMKDMGIFAVWAPQLEDALAANDLAYAHMTDRGLSNAWQSWSAVWPSQAIRKNNAKRWTEFWSARQEPLRDAFRRLGAAQGFSETAFDPFMNSIFEGAEAGPAPQGRRFFDQLAAPYVRSNEYGHMALSYFPETPPVQAALQNMPELPASSAVVSRSKLRELFASGMTREIRRLAFLGLLGIALAAGAILRNLRALLLLAITAAGAIAGALALLALTGQRLNASGMMALVLVIGLTLDYAVFKIEALLGRQPFLEQGILLSWLTTMAGALPLLAAHHPALFSFGLTLSGGLACGFFIALWVLEPAARALGLGKEKAHA